MKEKPELQEKKNELKKLSWSDKIAKLEIEFFTTHKFEELTPYQVTVVQSLVRIGVMVFIILVNVI